MNIGRVFHQKIGNGNLTAIDGNKVTIRQYPPSNFVH